MNRSENMRAVRGKDTKPEKTVRSMVHMLGYRFRLHRRSLPGKPDLVFPSLRKVIFVHGCFWHMHDCRKGRGAPLTNAAFWQAKRSGTAERDAKVIDALAAEGWESYVVWECELSSDALRTRLRAFLSGDARTDGGDVGGTAALKRQRSSKNAIHEIRTNLVTRKGGQDVVVSH